MTPTHAISADEARRLLHVDREQRELITRRRSIDDSPAMKEAMRLNKTETRWYSDLRGMDIVYAEARSIHIDLIRSQARNP